MSVKAFDADSVCRMSTRQERVNANLAAFRAPTHMGPDRTVYGVTTVESSKDGYNVTVSGSKLNIGCNLSDRRAPTESELWEAARKLNSHADLLAALEKIATKFAGKQAGDIASAALARAKGEA